MTGLDKNSDSASDQQDEPSGYGDVHLDPETQPRRGRGG
jgi:hypothetical protein